MGPRLHTRLRLSIGALWISLAGTACTTAEATHSGHHGPGQVDPETQIVGPTDHAATPRSECASSCAQAAEPVGQRLDPSEYARLLNTWSREPLGAPTLALETLLFHGAETSRLLEELGPGPLPADHAALLRRELAREHATLEMRVIDASGAPRALLPRTRVRFKEKQHLRLAHTGTLGNLETGGKIKRVGLAHLWSRW